MVAVSTLSTSPDAEQQEVPITPLDEDIGGALKALTLDKGGIAFWKSVFDTSEFSPSKGLLQRTAESWVREQTLGASWKNKWY